MDSKKLMLLGILVIAAGGAFVYFDPLDLNLLGLKQKPAVVKPSAAPTPTPVAKPPVIVPKAAVATTQTQMKASVAVPSPSLSPAPAAATSVAVPKAEGAPIQAKAPAGTTTETSSETASPPVTPPLVAEAVQETHPPMKLSKTTKTASKPATDKPARPKNQDLRYCLDLETDAAIAKCAGE
jgi:hypothetical protein